MLYDAKKYEPNPHSLLFKQAAAYMDEHGRCVGEARNKAGQVCWIGALERVGREDAALAAERFMFEHLNKGRKHARMLWRIHDTEISSKEEAVAVLRQMAEVVALEDKE